jgi:hypothetical protein
VIRRLFAAVAALATIGVVATPLGAQDTRLLSIRDAGVRAVVMRQLSLARERGFTVEQSEPLLSKALQGVAMQASPEKIRDAMETLEARMRRAAKLLEPNATVDEVTAGADALAVGAPERALREMRRLAPNRTITVELGVLTELVAKGVPPKRAAQRVRDVMARGGTGAQLTELNSAVQQDVAAGLRPEAALELRVRAVMSLLPPPPPVTTANPRP